MKTFKTGTRGFATPREDRAFVVRGETFYRRDVVSADVIAQADDALDGPSAVEGLSLLDGAILLLIEDAGQAHERWVAIRNDRDADDALTLADLIEIKNWLVRGVMRRPTEPSPPSSNGPAAAAPASSQDDSPSPEAPEEEASTPTPTTPESGSTSPTPASSMALPSPSGTQSTPL